MNRQPPLNTGKVLIGLHYWPRRSAQYASWIDAHPARRSRPNLWQWSGWIAFCLLLILELARG